MMDKFEANLNKISTWTNKLEELDNKWQEMLDDEDVVDGPESEAYEIFTKTTDYNPGMIEGRTKLAD
uniref:Uncharacterized protein n=1 Tax=Acrobeloides nanus TaxID=290746 RepID=A0A914CG34_9BILA